VSLVYDLKVELKGNDDVELKQEIEKLSADIAKKFNRKDSISNDLNSIYSLSKSLRAATKAQVKARQISNLINLA